jgi:enediyne biosynthesis protein E4
MLAACGERGKESTAPSPPPGDSTPESAAPFVDATPESNIFYKVGYTRPALIVDRGNVTESTFGGAASGDCDGDDDVDLFITYGNTSGPNGGGGPNRLYLNRLVETGEALSFEDIAEEAGVANTRLDGRGNDRHSGPTFADMDGDGDLDLFVGGLFGDPNKIYENDGNCRFTDVTANSPDVVNMRASHTISSSFGDYDLDGDLDMFLTHWATRDRVYAKVVAGELEFHETDHLWRNESDASGIRFVNVSEESGMSELTWSTRAEDFYGFPQDSDFTFTGTFARINGDLWPDIAIAADFGTTQLALNRGNGKFQRFESKVLDGAQFGMGSALGDVDNDGDLDWFVSSIFGPGDETKGLRPWGNRLFINDGTSFVDATERFGVADGSWGWAACFLDIDNDADLDIYHANGWGDPYLGHRVWQKPPARAFVMNESGTYADEAQALGLAVPAASRGAVCADFDQDGDMDILQLTRASPNSARLWKNHSAAAGRHFLRIRLDGTPPNTRAAGARILVRIGEVTQMREIMVGSNYTAQNPVVQVFGLGAAEFVDEILVEWPPLDRGEGPKQLGTLLRGPIAASEPRQTLVLRHPELPPP